MTAREGSFRFNGHRIAYAEYGEGERALVLAHGLLMNRHMYDRLAPEMATRGIRVISVDLLGHGGSDKPEDMRAYNMPAFGDQLAALCRPPGARPPDRRRHLAGRQRRARAGDPPPATRRAGCSSRCRCSTTLCSPPA